jgi:DNA (cytosine-5)-methyltransferase 1
MHILSAAFGWASPSEDKLQNLNTWTVQRPVAEAPPAK